VNGFAPLAVTAKVRRGAFALSVDLGVEPGEVLGVIGPNGAGKTTLLRAIAGLNPVEDGEIRLGEQVLDRVRLDRDKREGREGAVFVPPEKRPIGFVFQNYRLFAHMTVLNNVAFGPQCHGSGTREAREAAGSWLERLGISDLANRRPSQLSGGQAQRVALARALAVDPAVLLLDEPLAALDAETRLATRGELRRHLQEFAGVTVLVTHDPLEAIVMTDRLVVIENGRIVQEGAPAMIARQPATQYVARLVGLNLYEGGPDGVVPSPDVIPLSPDVILPSPEVILPKAGSSPPPTTNRMLMAIRPSAIRIHTTAPRVRTDWQGHVASIEPQIRHVRVDVTGTPPALVDLTPTEAAGLSLKEGQQVWLSVDPEDVEVYPSPVLRQHAPTMPLPSSFHVLAHDPAVSNNG